MFLVLRKTLRREYTDTREEKKTEKKDDERLKENQNNKKRKKKNLINGFLQSTEATKHKQGTGNFLRFGIYGGVREKRKKRNQPHINKVSGS